MEVRASDKASSNCLYLCLLSQTGMTPAIVVYLSLKAFASVRLTPSATSTVAFHESLSTTQRLSLNGGTQGNFLICEKICYLQKLVNAIPKLISEILPIQSSCTNGDTIHIVVVTHSYIHFGHFYSATL